MPHDRKKRVLLGRISSAHGIRGDVLVQSYTGDPADLASYGTLTDSTAARQFQIAQLRVTAKGVVVRFEGVGDRNAAEALRGVELYVDRASLPDADAGTYYHVDLVGLRALEPGGTEIGQVQAVQDFGGGTLLEIRKSGSPQTELVPFTDTFVPTVDIAAGHVVVVLPTMVGDPEPAAGEHEGGHDDAG